VEGGGEGLYFLAGEGKAIEQKSPGVWVVDGKVTLKLDLPGEVTAVVREGGSRFWCRCDLRMGRWRLTWRCHGNRARSGGHANVRGRERHHRLKFSLTPFPSIV
jgi:hypothetical protein